MSTSNETWPPQLKDWVATCLGQMTESNRAEAQTELRQVISDAFNSQTLWTTDWAGVQLQSLLPKPTPNLNALKRKFSDGLTLSSSGNHQKKQKKVGFKNGSHDFNDQAALKRRAERFKREHDIEREKKQVGLQDNPKSIHARVFGGKQSNSPPYFTNADDDPEGDPNAPNWDHYAIVGTCQDTYKDYLRLTDVPNPDFVRPLDVLRRKTLVALKDRWRQKANYNWICSQFKSMRQDLRVQNIRNEFTVEVYEIHARMALEYGDMVEYNQCQGMLKELYDEGISGKMEEFTAYRILMLLHGRNRSDLNLYVGQLTPEQKAYPSVRHALEVLKAMSMNNYHAFFDLYQRAPNMGAYIMDHFVDRERTRAMIIISKAYAKVSLKFISEELAFESITQASEFLSTHNAAKFHNPNSPEIDRTIICKDIQGPLAKIMEEKYSKTRIRGAI